MAPAAAQLGLMGGATRDPFGIIAEERGLTLLKAIGQLPHDCEARLGEFVKLWKR